MGGRTVSTRSISSAVLSRPREKRTLLRAVSGERPMAERTWLGSRLPLVQAEPLEQAALMERARELLKLETIPRELVVALIEKIEIGEKDRETGKQEIRITWKF